MLESLDRSIGSHTTSICNSHLLYNSAAIHLQGQGQDMVLHLIRQNLLLGLVAVLKEFLNDIIPEDVSHQLHCIR